MDSREKRSEYVVHSGLKGLSGVANESERNELTSRVKNDFSAGRTFVVKGT